MHRRAGLSLLDLTVAMLIVGIIGAVGSLKYADALRAHRLQGAALAISEDLRSAQHAARTRGAPVTVVFDKDAETYTITGMPNPAKPSQPFQVNVRERFGVEIKDSKFDANKPLVINAFGNCASDKDGDIKLHIGKGKADERTIRVRKVSGAIEAD